MKKKTLLIVFMAFIALVGITNCMVIEPALACNDHAPLSQLDKAHCAITCHSSSHTWMAAESTDVLSVSVTQEYFHPNEMNFSPDPQVVSILHPPRVF